MPVDGIEGQRRGIRRLAHDLAVGQKSQLHQRLKAVADSKGKPVPFVQKLHNRFFDLLVLEGRCEEFGRAVRFVSCGKTAREHDDLRLTDGLLKGIHRLPDIAAA